MSLLRWVSLLLVGAALVACGVGPETVPRPLPVGGDPAVAAPANPRDRAGVLVELWFVEDDQVVPVNRTSDTTLNDEEKLDALEAGPTASEAAQGLRTALTPVMPDSTLVVTAESDEVPVDVQPNQIAVVLNPEFVQLPSQEQLLILGQVVLTLSDNPGTTILFVDDKGTPVGVPLPNGKLTSEPVGSADYAQLIKS